MSAVQTTVKLNDLMSPALKKIMSNMEKVRADFDKFQQTADKSWDSSGAEEMAREIESIISSTKTLQSEMESYGSETQRATQATEGLESAVGRVATAVMGILSIRQVADWVGSALESANTENSARTQLQATMRNMGNLDGYDQLIAKADEIQQAGIYGNEAMIGAMAEFSTYMTDTDAISVMTDTLTDYIAGMTGGGSVSAEEAVNFATNLGKITTGAFDAMTKKGFQFTDAQKAVVKGTATEAQSIEALGANYKDLSEDMQKAEVIRRVIAESWDGMYSAMSKTPEASVIRLKNAWGDVQEEIGNQIYPAVQELCDTIMANLPEIQSLLEDGASIVTEIIGGMTELVSWAGQHKDQISQTIAVLGNVLMIYGEIQGAILLVESAQKAWNFITNINPWVALAGAVLMAVNSLLLYNYMDEQTQTNTLVGWYSVITAIAVILDALLTPLFEIATAGITVAMTVQDAFITAFSYVAEFVTNVCIGIIGMISAIASGIAFLQGKEADLTLYNNQINGMIDLQDQAKGLRNGVDWSDNTNSIVEYNTKYALWTEHGRDFITGVGTEAVDTIFNAFGATGSSGNAPKLSIDDVKVDTSSFGAGGGASYDPQNTKNTGSCAKSLELATEDIKYIRDIAERDVVNKFTTAEIKVDMNNNNTINSEMDIDGIVNVLENKLYETLVTTAEAVHV